MECKIDSTKVQVIKVTYTPLLCIGHFELISLLPNYPLWSSGLDTHLT